MTQSEQYQDYLNQAQYLETEATEFGYNSIQQLFEDEPELFDKIAEEYRMKIE